MANTCAPTSMTNLVNALDLLKSQGPDGRTAMNLVRMDLVVLDELGYRPLSQVGGVLLFHHLSSCTNTPAF